MSVYATNLSYDAYTVASKQLVGLVLLCIFDYFHFFDYFLSKILFPS